MSTASTRRMVAGALVAIGAAATLVAGAGPASAHADHPGAVANPTTSTTATTTPTTGTSSTTATSATIKTATTTETATTVGTGTLVGRDPGRDRSDGPALIAGRGGVAGLDVECFVDFDDDLVLQYSIPDSAADTIMRAPWYQACYDNDYYPAMAVKPMEYGHFHLGYQDARIGPCAGDQTDFGRKQDPEPELSDPGWIDWLLADCVSDIDPATEPRTGISNHLPGQRAQIVAYDGDGHLPFQLRTLKVEGDDVEVCHLPPGPWEAAFPGGSPWQCLTVGEGYWDLSNHVGNAIEVRIEYLGQGMLDNIGIDLLEG